MSAPAVYRLRFTVVALLAVGTAVDAASAAQGDTVLSAQASGPSTPHPPGSLGERIVRPDRPAPSPTDAGSTGGEALPPIGKGEVLSEAQIRYCLAEKVRIDAVRPVLNRYDPEEVRGFNERVADFNGRCSSYRFYGSARDDAAAWLELERPRIEQEARDAHVLAQQAAGRSKAARRSSQRATAAQTTSKTPVPPSAEGHAAEPAMQVTADQGAVPAVEPVAGPDVTREAGHSTADAPASSKQPQRAATAPPEMPAPPPPLPSPSAPAAAAAGATDDVVAATATSAQSRQPRDPTAGPVPMPPPPAPSVSAPTEPVGSAGAQAADIAPRSGAQAGSPAGPAPEDSMPVPSPPAPSPVPSRTEASAGAAGQTAAAGGTAPTAPPVIAKAEPATEPAQAAAGGSSQAALAKLTQEVHDVGSMVLARPKDATPGDVTAQLEVRYAAAGFINSIVIAESSGSPFLDEEALARARALRLPNAPQELRGQEFSVRFPVVFRSPR